MTIAYNHLNLPKLMTFTGGAQSNTIEILYDAAGTKLKKTVKTGTTTNYYQDYIGGIEYRDGVREAIYHAEGRLYYTSPTVTRYEYAIKDHLGNTRLTFTDKDADGVVDVLNTTANEILQENHYYPFGLNTEGPWMNDAALDNRYQYSGKEWNDDFGLNLNDYGARWYDASVGRFSTTDILTDMYASWTPYAYTMNNPLKFIDPTGMMSEAYNFGFTDWGAMQEDHQGRANVAQILHKISKAEENGGHYADESVSEFFVYEKTTPEIYNHTVAAQASGHPRVLTYDSNTERRDARRKKALYRVPIKPGQHRDEYPYASTEEGGAGASVRHVSPAQNLTQGGLLSVFYKTLNSGDMFLVVPVPDSRLPEPGPVLVPQFDPRRVTIPKSSPNFTPSLIPVIIRSISIVPFIIYLDPEFFPSQQPNGA